jgi:hypothetical protein
MNTQVIDVNETEWKTHSVANKWLNYLEAGKVLHFTKLNFPLSELEKSFFTPKIRNPKSRNISLDASGHLKGALGNAEVQAGLATMMARYRAHAQTLVNSYFPCYTEHLSVAPTSFRPNQIETRSQSWRADDKRLHVDAFPSRPNYGERILRVFINVNPNNVPRVWRVGEPFEDIAQRFLPNTKPYSAWQAKVLNVFGITKSLRSEYDHLMLQLHDAMKHDLNYQSNSPQLTIEFPSGSVWVCFSDQASHAAMSGQFMMEQTFHLTAKNQYDTNTSPLAMLQGYTGRQLI